MEQFIGKWQVTDTENMEQMLRAFDMEDEKRRMYCDMRFTMEYSRHGDNWSYSVSMPHGHSKTFNFTPGKEFDSFTLDGRPIISKIDIEDGRFVEVHKDKADPTLDAVMTREVVDGQLIVTATVKSISSITRHKRV